MDFILAIVLLLLAVAGVVIRKTYYYLPARELKRRAAQDDRQAAQLYQAVAYGNSLRGLLWIFIALTSAGGVILLTRTAPVWLSLAAVIGLLWVVYAWLPASRLTAVGFTLTSLATPLITKLLSWLHPTLDRLVEIVSRRYTAEPHTGIFEREDLHQLIERQQTQPDSRITAEELAIARNALSFSDRQVGEVLIPRKKVKTVLAGDTIGPVLIDELHKSGQNFVLVRDKKGGQVIGSLEFGKLGLDSKGKVSDLMDETVYYVHQKDSLAQALHAFFVTNHPVFIVVNNFEEFVGIITIENILEQLLGHVPGDDFDQYANPAAVAARHAKSQKDDSPEAEAEPENE